MKLPIKRIVGGILAVGGAAWGLFVLWSAVIYFYADDKILCFFPWLAKPVSMEQLVEAPDRFAGNWVELRGELWLCTDKDAVLVPVGSGAEPDSKIPPYLDLYRKRNLFPGRTAKTAIDDLPKPHLYLHNFRSRKIQTFSALDAPRNTPVVFIAEFEAEKENFPQHLDAVWMMEPAQPYLFPAIKAEFFRHLFPGLAALTVFMVGLKLNFPFRCKRNPTT